VTGVDAMPDYDVIVIGGGGAGLAAAASAAQSNARVLLVEAAGQLGGSTRLAGGSFMAAGTPTQAQAGYPDDTADAFFDYYLTFNRWDVEPAIARRFCDRALPTMTWLTELGVVFPVEGLYRAGLEPAPRSHRPTGGGAAIVEALSRAARALDVDIALGRRVERLSTSADGLVRCTDSTGEPVTATSVVLTTGGFGHDRELVRQHIPDAAFGGDEVWSPAADTCVGDGLRFAAQLGASTTGRNRGDLLLSSGLVRDIEPYPPGWLVFVDGQGRRYVNELAPYTVITPLTIAHGGAGWVLFDDVACRAARPRPDSAWGAGTWTTETLLDGVAKGVVRTASDLGELAKLIDVQPSVLRATVERYNADCESGVDTEFFKDPQAMRPIATPPFYAVELRPRVVAVTGYGLRIDPDARVLDPDGHPIPGVFAAGEVTGNVIGPQYLGGGNAIGSALIFGRIAGQSAIVT